MALIKLHGSTALQKVDSIASSKLQKMMGISWQYYQVPVTWSTSDQNSGLTLSADKLTVTASSLSSWQTVRADNYKQASGKWYFEIKPKSLAGPVFIGISDTALALTAFCGNSTGSISWWPLNTEYYTAGTPSESGRDFSTADTVMVAFDIDNKKMWFGANSTWNGGGDPAAGTNPAFSTLSSTIKYHPCVTMRQGAEIIANFGDSSFTYSPPAGFSRM